MLQVIMAARDKNISNPAIDLNVMIDRIFDRWEHSSEERGVVFPDDVTRDERTKYFLNIFGFLGILYPGNPEILLNWVRYPFNGRTALDVMLKDGLAGLRQVYVHLDGCLQQ